MRKVWQQNWWLGALAGGVAMLVWQALAVYVLFGGDWTGLILVGERTRLPAALEGKAYVWKGAGYDGQFYWLMAHDPLMRADPRPYIDAPRIRYRRILLSAFAWCLSLGGAVSVSGAYLVVIWAALTAGVAWLALVADLRGQPACYGLAFLLIPGVLVSVERATLDGGLAAATVAWIYFDERGRRGWAHAALAAAPLIRETGLVLTLGAAAREAAAKRWKETGIALATAAPAAGWFLYVEVRLWQFAGAGGAGAPAPGWLFRKPVIGVLERIMNPVGYPYSGWRLWLPQALDAVALAGVLLGLAVTALWLKDRRSGAAVTAAAFGLFSLAVHAPGFFEDIHGWVRVLAPWQAALMAGAVGEKRWALALPAAMALPRLGLSLAAPVTAVARQAGLL